MAEAIKLYVKVCSVCGREVNPSVDHNLGTSRTVYCDHGRGGCGTMQSVTWERIEVVPKRVTILDANGAEIRTRDKVDTENWGAQIVVGFGAYTPNASGATLFVIPADNENGGVMRWHLEATDDPAVFRSRALTAALPAPVSPPASSSLDAAEEGTCDHDFEDISNGTTLVNVSYCRSCGSIGPTAKARNLRADFPAAREEIARRQRMDAATGQERRERALQSLRTSGFSEDVLASALAAVGERKPVEEILELLLGGANIVLAGGGEVEVARRLKKGRVKTLASDGLVLLQAPTRQHEGIKRATNERWGKGERITPEQAEALTWLTEDYQRPFEIAERLGLKMTRSQVNGRFATLCKKGLAEREPDTRRVRLTALGGAERVGAPA